MDSSAASIRVLVVDGHAVVRAGLRSVLDAEPDIETIAEAADAERALRPRARGAAPASARPYEPGDREDVVHLRADGGDVPGAIMQKLGFSSRAELVRYAIAEGLLEE